MAIKFLDNLDLSTIANASVDTDKFLVSDSGVIKYRTGDQVRSDIGAGTGNGTVTSTNGSSSRLAVFSTSSNINGDGSLFWNSGNELVIDTSSAQLTISDTDEETNSPTINFKQTGNLSSQIIVNKASNFNILTSDASGNMQTRLIIGGKLGDLSLLSYTATAIAIGATAINPNQNFYPVGTLSDKE